MTVTFEQATTNMKTSRANTVNKTSLDLMLSQLMQKSQAGDAAAYHALLTELSRMLDRFLARKIDQKETRDDLCQEILISIDSSKQTYDPALPFLPWLYAIANFKVIDHWRRIGRRPEHILLDEGLHDSLASEFSRESLLSEMGVTEHLLGLPEKQRRAVELVKQEGLSVAEAAKRLNMSESAIKVSIHRAIRAIRKQLGIKENTDEN